MLLVYFSRPTLASARNPPQTGQHLRTRHRRHCLGLEAWQTGQLLQAVWLLPGLDVSTWKHRHPAQLPSRHRRLALHPSAAVVRRPGHYRHCRTLPKDPYLLRNRRSMISKNTRDALAACTGSLGAMAPEGAAPMAATSAMLATRLGKGASRNASGHSMMLIRNIACRWRIAPAPSACQHAGLIP